MTDDQGPKTLHEWELLLLDQLAQTKYDYVTASHEYQRLLAIAADAGSVARSDGVISLNRAVELHRAKYAAYRNALHRFTDLTIYGRLPEDTMSETGGPLKTLADRERGLLAEYRVASKCYAGAVEELSRSMGIVSSEKFKKLVTMVEDARTECERIRQRLMRVGSAAAASSS